MSIAETVEQEVRKLHYSSEYLRAVVARKGLSNPALPDDYEFQMELKLTGEALGLDSDQFLEGIIKPLAAEFSKLYPSTTSDQQLFAALCLVGRVARPEQHKQCA